MIVYKPIFVCFLLFVITLNVGAAELSIYQGPLESTREEIDTEIKYLTRIISEPIGLWIIDDQYYLLIGVFEDYPTAKLQKISLMDSGYTDLSIRMANPTRGKRLKFWGVERSEYPALLGHEKKDAESPLYIDQSHYEVPKYQIKELEPDTQKGWSELIYGSPKRACQFFRRALDNHENKIQVFHGLSQCLQMLEKHEEAIEKLEWLNNQGFQQLNTVPLIIKSYKALGNKERVQFYTNRLYEIESKLGIKHREDNRRRIEFVELISHNDTNGLMLLLERNEQALTECRTIDIFMDAAGYLTVKEQNKNVIKIYRGILNSCEGKWSLRLALLELLSKFVPFDEIEQAAEKEKKNPLTPPVYVKKINALLISNYLARLYALSSSSKKKDVLSDKIFHINPTHKETMAIMGWVYLHRKQFDKSYQLFSQLLKRNPKNKKYGQGVYYNLLALKQPKKAAKLAKKMNLKAQWLQSLEAELAVAKDQDKISLAQQIVAISPSHQWALSVLAWHSYNANQFKDSFQFFNRLLNSSPKDAGFVEGYLLSLISVLSSLPENTFGASFKILDASDMKDELKNNWRVKLHRQYAGKLFDQKQYGLAKKQYIQISNPTDTDKQMLGWCEFHLGNDAKALQIFTQIFSVNPAPSIAEAILIVLQKLEQKERLQVFANELFDYAEPEYRQLAAPFLAGTAPQLSAQYLEGDGEYKHWHHPYIDITDQYFEQTGDPGITLLYRRVKSYWVHLPWWGRWSGALVIHDEQVNAGSISQPTIGSDYLTQIVNPKWNQLHEDVKTSQLRIQYQGSSLNVHAIIGETAANGPIDNTYAGALYLTGFNYSLSIYRIPRSDSLLAYLGMNDPYTQRQWGRMLDDGLAVSKDWSLRNDYWMNGRVAAGEIAGHRVEANPYASLNIAFGVTDNRWGGQVTRGLFAGVSGHDHDSDFYTYGHGGVYSPNISLNAGPLLNIESLTRSTFWWRVDGSIAAYHVTSRPIEQYPSDGRPERSDYSESKGLAYNASGRFHWFFGHHVKIYGAGKWSKADTFKTWGVLGGIQYYFYPRSKVGVPDPDFNLWRARWPQRM